MVFDFDGTLSWLRHGWPELMCGLFLEVLPLKPGESEAGLHDFLLGEILSLNGKSTIHQMKRCAELAVQRGVTPPSPAQLLEEYQGRLDARIAERSAQIVAGDAKPDDFVVWGGRAFLQLLAGRGLTLIILSGTPEPRVRQEADLLQLTPFFGSHVYGARPDASSDKRSVIQRLMKEENLLGRHLLAFGDGPVEIAVTKAAGGCAVGVASDEDVNGSGLLHAQKVVQLRDAGADVLIPDYREPEGLIEALMGYE